MSGTVLSIFYSYYLSHVIVLAIYDILTIPDLKKVILNVTFVNLAQPSSKHIYIYSAILQKPASLDLLGLDVK